jgi:hypothetical protein
MSTTKTVSLITVNTRQVNVPQPDGRFGWYSSLDVDGTIFSGTGWNAEESVETLIHLLKSHNISVLDKSVTIL